VTRREVDVPDPAEAEAEAEAVRRALAAVGGPARRGAGKTGVRALRGKEGRTASGPGSELEAGFLVYLSALCADPAEAVRARNTAVHSGWAAGTRGCSCREVARWQDLGLLANRAAPQAQVPDDAALCDPQAEAGSTAQLPDPEASRAVFVGVGSSPGLAELPEAEAAAGELAEWLGRVARPTVLRGADATAARIRRHLARAAGEAEDLLTLHVATHGLAERDTGRVHLATADGTMSLAEVLELTGRTRAKRVLILLDACETSVSEYAGWQSDGDRATYMITATDGEPALARNPVRGGGATAFTGAVITALARGVPGSGETLDVVALYTAVDRMLERDTLPRPRMYAWGADRARWAIARNRHPRATDPAWSDPRRPELLERAGAGETAAWGTLVERYGKLVWACVRAFRLGQADSADAAARTWLAVAGDLERLTADAFTGFLVTTARHAALDALRQHEPADAGRPRSCSCSTGSGRALERNGWGPAATGQRWCCEREELEA